MNIIPHNFTIEGFLLVLSLLLFVSLAASKLSGKFGIPALILFLAVGMLAGSNGPLGIYFDDPNLAQSFGIIALSFILFSGGLNTRMEEMRPVIGKGLSLATIGVLITTVIVGLAIHLLTDLNIYEGFLLGAIVSSTDAAAVFSILQSRSLNLKHRIAQVLELESGSNDPMAYFLTITLTQYLLNPNPGQLGWILPNFVINMAIGAIVGFVMGKFTIYIINKIHLQNPALYPVLSFSLVLFSYSFANLIQGNGFLAVYITGIILGNGYFINKNTIVRFSDGIAWLMQILMFITLGMLVFPDQIPPVIGIGLIISLILIFIARPISVFVSLLFYKVNLRSKIFISLIGLRGASPIVFATYPLIAGIDKSNMIFNIVFFIVITSVLLQGSTISILAKILKLDKPIVRKLKSFKLYDDIKNELTELIISKNSTSVGKELVELKFPSTSLIVLINRENKYITPKGSTQLMANDKLLIMTESKGEIPNIKKCLDIE
ncbi:MAG: potassium/proton antiporter [Hyphomicrobiales bacterium]